MRQQQAAVGGNEIEVPGGLAQLGEHLLCKQGVVGSIPSTSTIIIIVTIIRTIPKTRQ
jgi:hypothetical protein